MDQLFNHLFFYRITDGLISPSSCLPNIISSVRFSVPFDLFPHCLELHGKQVNNILQHNTCINGIIAYPKLQIVL